MEIGSDEYGDLIEDVAGDIVHVLAYIDVLLLKYKLSDIDLIIENMDENSGILQALPFSETMRKAEVSFSQVETFKKIRDLMVAREKQIEIKRKPDTTPGEDILKHLGYME